MTTCMQFSLGCVTAGEIQVTRIFAEFGEIFFFRKFQPEAGLYSYKKKEFYNQHYWARSMIQSSDLKKENYSLHWEPTSRERCFAPACTQSIASSLITASSRDKLFSWLQRFYYFAPAKLPNKPR
jgi:hypothetical protein